MELVTSGQPCIQCYGNLWWSGLRRLVVGARKEDIETLAGFSEGPLPHTWADQLEIARPCSPLPWYATSCVRQRATCYGATVSRGANVYNPS